MLHTSARIQQLKTNIEPLRKQIIHHPVYAEMKTMEHLQTFMQYHVFAVWDFMSLLKTLQNSLTCTSIPWIPIGTADTRYLINEIVTGEESDVDMNGKRASHFELYLDAMQQSGADVHKMHTFLKELNITKDVSTALNNASVTKQAANFVMQTFGIIATEKPHIQSAVFTFGREDLIPSMFTTLVADLTAKFPEKVSIFNYYLERHIEVDGDHHSHLALEMTASLCDTGEKWEEAEKAVIESLQSRINLWDGVLAEIKEKTLASEMAL